MQLRSQGDVATAGFCVSAQRGAKWRALNNNGGGGAIGRTREYIKRATIGWIM